MTTSPADDGAAGPQWFEIDADATLRAARRLEPVRENLNSLRGHPTVAVAAEAFGGTGGAADLAGRYGVWRTDFDDRISTHLHDAECVHDAIVSAAPAYVETDGAAAQSLPVVSAEAIT